MRLALRQVVAAPKVPRVNFAFWYLKILTTAMGEAASDFLVHRFNPELAVLGAAAVFVVVMWWQLTRPRYQTFAYWAAIVMVSVFGTMCADVLHVGLGVPYAVSTVSFAVVLAAVFLTWSRVEHTLSIHTIISTRRELFYWSAVTATFALGTALGDFTATTVGLGYLASGFVFAALFALPGLTFALRRRHAVACFWIAYVLTRPMGASFADYLGVSHVRGGLNWGPGNVALLFGGLFAVGVAVLATRERA